MIKFDDCIRVLKLTKKPTNDEFKKAFIVSVIGMAIIGGIGFIMHMVRGLF